MSKTKTPTTITAPAIFRICDKVSHNCIGYGVPSDCEPGKIYFVTWDATKHCYQCNGEKCGKAHDCKHRRAVVSVLAAKKQLEAARHLAAVTKQEEDALVLQEAEQMLREDAPTSVAVVATVPPQKSKPIIDKATSPLGGNKAFSLMR